MLNLESTYNSKIRATFARKNEILNAANAEMSERDV